MSDYHSDEQLNEPVDQRPFLISGCFITISITSSLFIFMTLENAARQSFLMLHSPILNYSRASSAVMFAMFMASVVAVVSVWIQHRRALVGAAVCKLAFLVCLVVIIVFVASLYKGAWHPELYSEFHKLNENNMTCPGMHGAHCCGWNTTCIPACPWSNTTCASTIHSEIGDFTVRVLPMTAIAIFFALLTLHMIPLTLKQWSANDTDSNIDSFDESAIGSHY